MERSKEQIRDFGTDFETDIAAIEDLLTREYQESGYVTEEEGQEDPAEMQQKQWLLTPPTRVFTAYMRNGTLAGTVSVIPDKGQLPMGIVFENELNDMRTQGMRLAQATQFAVDRKLMKKNTGARSLRKSAGPRTALALVKTAIHWSVEQNDIDMLCIAVNPRHKGFYTRVGFEIFCAEKLYPLARNNPAVPMRLNLKKLPNPRFAEKPEHFIIAEMRAVSEQHVLPA